MKNLVLALGLICAHHWALWPMWIPRCLPRLVVDHGNILPRYSTLLNAQNALADAAELNLRAADAAACPRYLPQRLWTRGLP